MRAVARTILRARPAWALRSLSSEDGAKARRRPESRLPPRVSPPPTTTGLEAEAGSVVWEGEEGVQDPRVLGFGWIDDSVKTEIYECYMHDSARFSVPELARIFGLREARIRAVLLLKQDEARRQARGEVLNEQLETDMNSWNSTMMQAMSREYHVPLENAYRRQTEARTLTRSRAAGG